MMEKKITHTPSSRKAFEMFDEVFDKVVAFPPNKKQRCHHHSGGGINQQTTAIGWKMRDGKWEM